MCQKWVNLVPNKKSKLAVKLTWVRDRQRVQLETRRREEVTSDIGTKRLLTCAVDISMKKRITSSNKTAIVSTITINDNGSVEKATIIKKG